MNSSRNIIKQIVIYVIFLSISFGALLMDVPIQLTQPNGDIFHCYASGDEYYSYLHDSNGYTIVQSTEDGYYYYAQKYNGNIVPSLYLANQMHDLELYGISKKIIIPRSQYLEKRERWWSGIDEDRDAPSIGIVNNLNVFIRFADEEEFSIERSYYDGFFNGEDGPSMKHYFLEVSYDTLTVNTIHYPDCEMTTNISYQDGYPRSYYQPYNEVTNPNGYNGDGDRTTREHELLYNAVEYIADEVPDDLIIDANNDNLVDNVTFLISGAPGGWADLLWPHRWALYTVDSYIGDKRVWDYNFNLSSGPYFSVGTLCHEFGHSLGAPDLYHYYDDTAPVAVGGWDVMDATADIPQYPSAYIKYRYFDWITLEEASGGGTFSINPSTSPANNAYRLDSVNPNEYFVIEYRIQNGIYDSNTPGIDQGILIYRVNNLYSGEGNAQGPPDELYIYRVGGTPTTSGSFGAAIFSEGVNRTEFNDTTNPSSFLSDNSPGGINIINIGEAGDTIEFTVLNLMLLGNYQGFNNDSDHDGMINPGESVILEFNLSNMSNDIPANSVMGYLSSDADIDFPDFGIDFGNVAAGATTEIQMVQINISNNIDLGYIPITLSIEADYEQDGNTLNYTGNITFDIYVSLNQYGFPNETDFPIKASPLILNIDNQNDFEIIIGDYDGFIRAYKSDGVEIENNIFPYETDDQIWGSPASADIDLDGVVDFVFASKDKNLYLFDQNGFKDDINLLSYLMGTPSIGNIDDDEELEIIIGGYSSNNEKIYVLNHDLTYVEGFPVDIGEKIKSGVSLADFNNNGKSDIVFGTDNHNIYLMFDDGTIADGFPFQTGGAIHRSPTILNHNSNLFIVASSNDGQLYILNSNGSEHFITSATDVISTSPAFLDYQNNCYIFFGDDNGYLHAIDINGNSLPGFPMNFGSAIAESVVFSDLDYDGTPEIIFGTDDGHMYAITPDGNSYNYMPLSYPFSYYSAPLISDVDEDGDLEIIAGTSLSINAIDIKESGNNDSYWSMYKGNPKRDGLYLSLTCISGDIDNDGFVDILDLVILVYYILDPSGEIDCADINDDSSLDILDITEMVNIIINR